jgi:hypothetical protein
MYNESLSINSAFEYISENIIGLLLLLLTFLIIYLVDYISYINSLLTIVPSPVPGLEINRNNIHLNKKYKVRRSKNKN